MRERLEQGKVYRFFSLERINSETLLFRKYSYLIEEKTNKVSETSETKQSYITTNDLLNKSANTVINDPILMKVLKIYEMRKTSNGIDFRKVLLSDQFHQLNLTLWRDDAKNVSRYFEEDAVYSLNRFIMDSWPRDEGDRPKDIKFDRKNTNIVKIKSENIPSSFDTVKWQNNDQVLVGQIRFLDELYEYKSCPGKHQFCGKAVKTGQIFCSKIGCSLKVDVDKLVDDYRVKLMLVDTDNDFHSVTAFAKTLRMFEQKGDSITDRLDKVIGVTVKLFVNPSKGENDPILNKLEFGE